MLLNMEIFEKKTQTFWARKSTSEIVLGMMATTGFRSRFSLCQIYSTMHDFTTWQTVKHRNVHFEIQDGEI